MVQEHDYRERAAHSRPRRLRGSGYINVAFIRSLDSKEIFTSPLSYAVVPFTANIEKRRLNVELETAEDREAGRAASDRIQDGSAREDRRLRGRPGHSCR